MKKFDLFDLNEVIAFVLVFVGIFVGSFIDMELGIIITIVGGLGFGLVGMLLVDSIESWISSYKKRAKN